MNPDAVFATSASAGRAPARPTATPEPGAWPPAAAALPDAQLLTMLRALALGVQALALLLAWQGPHPVALFVLATGVAPFALASLLALIRARRQGTLDDAAFLRHILVDLAALSLFIGIAGGPDNPFSHLLFLPLAVAAASLPAPLVWRVTACGVGCYVLISHLHLPLPAGGTALLETLRVGRWLDHSLLAVGLSYFVLNVTKSVRQREQALAELRERETRAGCAIVLGSVAAGAAHELGTPLSTIATELGELRATRSGDAELQRSVATMQASVGACLQSLQALRLTGSAWIGGQQAMAADELVERVVERFRSMRPGAHLELRFDAARPAPRVQPDMGLQQAIINLLSNAAFVSPQQVQVVAGWTARELLVRVIDQGPGVPPAIAAQLGSAFVSSKPPAEGRGVGLFLSQVTVGRLGGRLVLANATGGGAVAEISIPLDALKVREETDG